MDNGKMHILLLLPLVCERAQDELTPLDIIRLGEMTEAREAFKLAHGQLLALKADPDLKSGNEKMANGQPLSPREMIAPAALKEKTGQVGAILARYGELKAGFRKQRAAAKKPQPPARALLRA